MHCHFQRHTPDLVRCTHCGRTARFSGDPARLRASCGTPPVAAPLTVAPSPIEFPCRYRGAVLRTVVCKACSRRGQLAAVYACALHGECALRRTQAGGPTLATCLTCRDRTS